MGTRKYLIVGIVLCFFTTMAFSADTEFTQGFSDCMDKTEGVKIELLNCIEAETKIQDARLNKGYKEVMAQLSAPRKKQLQEAQRAWVKYRDANCGFYADPDGGMMSSINSSDCLMSATASRAKEVEHFKE